MSLTCLREVTSVAIAIALRPWEAIWSAVSFAPFPLRSAHTTFAPSRAKIIAAARPMPLEAPVMMMVLPTKYFGVLDMADILASAMNAVYSLLQRVHHRLLTRLGSDPCTTSSFAAAPSLMGPGSRRLPATWRFSDQ